MSSTSLPSQLSRTVVPNFERWTLRKLLLYTAVYTLAIVFLFPLFVAVITSFKTRAAVTQTLPFIPVFPWQEGFTIAQWAQAFSVLQNGLLNSFLRVIPATTLTAILGSLTAYSLTKIKWRGQVAVLLMMVAATFFPTQAAIVPIARFWSVYVPLDQLLGPVWTLPLLEPYHGDLLALIITDIAYGLPVVTVLFRGYYQTINQELIEAAKIDGANMYSIYRRIILPMSVPMFAVVFIFHFTQVWNSFLFPLIIMSGAGHSAAPATLALGGLGQSLEGTNYGLRMAGALLTALPTVIVFILAGDKFASGIQGGRA
ncbi:carbohydrate ABC transporter permease [Haloarcula salina]|uniref:Carbohydrate ABC transporter permease n=1 Tax=Haloarcula salina TaxID=1429914 RepID=A0AA41KK72_9EURY|nr:carbohydrate ABC transporter permease [Haloarcula salina]MBV0903518.1 carbohydrate ABC transporter permease [Haloarcula salina]